MIRILIFLLAVAAAAAGLHWLADRPGTIVVEWQDYVAETSVFLAVVLMAVLVGALLLLWSFLRQVWASPAAVGRLLRRRRLQRGLDAISGGIIAIGAGDGSLATRYALQAKKSLPNEPLTHLLRAQAAQLNGDPSTARRIFEAMLASPDTAQLGLRGLFLEAQREGETEAARQFAERALKLNAKLAWPVEALFDLMCKARDWQGALATLAVAQRQNLLDKAVAQRRRAVLLTAKAREAEDSEPESALELALEAHRLAPDLVPAATIAGRILASQGNTPRAARV
ncbi:MAG TPA: heme biosynthesis HemY N-terminal domain-containing protein, partial [Hyphomicrobiaceae bacterium]|nr:heme biosynthesis HemY N-terminal domain-containing protein [Hyphomicrobiaceae bacterium]